jgi:hypothetical protein
MAECFDVAWQIDFYCQDTRGIFVPKGMFVAFVVSSQHISLHPYIHTSIHTDIQTYIHTYIHTYIQTYRQTYRQTSVDSITQIHS